MGALITGARVEGVSEPPPVADLERRLQAVVLDAALVGALVILTAFGFAVSWSGSGVAGALGALFALGCTVPALAAILCATGTTPGKSTLGLRVVRHDTGARLDFGPALLRTLVVLVATLPTAGLGLAWLARSALSDPQHRRRGWHDRVTGSTVVDARPAPVQDGAPRNQPLVNLTTMRLVAVSAHPTMRATPPRPPAEGRGGLTPSAPGNWRLVLDTGDSVRVDAQVLVGRAPRARGDRAVHLLRTSPGDLSVSRTHARVHVAGDGALVVTDLGSANGSVLLRGGVARDLPPDRPATLLDGDRVRLGDWEMRVEQQPVTSVSD